jgi:murein DD-endopeptidase MepM/ murein hydrolase activator NlpD
VLGASLAAAALTPLPAADGAGHPRPGDLRCLSECAGLRAAAVGGKVRLSGHRLGRVSEVKFVGEAGALVVAPDRAEPKQVVATVPAGAASGLVRVANPTGGTFASKRVLRVAGPGEVPEAFKLLDSQVRPQHAFFDQAGPIRVRYRFGAAERIGVRVEVMRVAGKQVIRAFRQPNRLPYTRYERAWSGLENDGDVADDGAYRFRVGPFGGPTTAAGQLKLHGYKFPVRGGHGYGGYLQSFGAPRSGGRRHQGQDVYAGCGTRLEAARGGKVQAKAYDSALYGHYVVIDIAKSGADHMYAHMPSPSPFGQGDRVHTGQRIGAVGRTGNARTTPCHLHFEIWPNGWRNGSPVNPLGSLKRWDGWS